MGKSRALSRFDRYLLSQLLALFGFFSLVLVAVYWINRAVLLFDQLIGEGHSIWVFLEISALSLPGVIAIVLPLSAFAGTVFVVNRLTQESELVVMQATGFSPFRLARPVMIFGILVTVPMAILFNFLVPASRGILNEEEAALSQNVAARFLHEGRFLHPSEGVTLFIREITPQSQLLGLFIMDERNPQERVTYIAKSAVLVRTETNPKLLMFEGSLQRLSSEGRLSVTRFDDLSYDVVLSDTTNKSVRRAIATMNSIELFTLGRALVDTPDQRSAGVIARELHMRLSQPLFGIGAALIGFSTLLLGAYSRFGLWKQIIVAILLMVSVHLISTQTLAAVSRDNSLWPILYIAPIVGILLPLTLLWWAGRDRRLGKDRGVTA
jgi:lipopolysaccharide export system permease protein